MPCSPSPSTACERAEACDPGGGRQEWGRGQLPPRRPDLRRPGRRAARRRTGRPAARFPPGLDRVGQGRSRPPRVRAAHPRSRSARILPHGPAARPLALPAAGDRGRRPRAPRYRRTAERPCRRARLGRCRGVGAGRLAPGPGAHADRDLGPAPGSDGPRDGAERPGPPVVLHGPLPAARAARAADTQRRRRRAAPDAEARRPARHRCRALRRAHARAGCTVRCARLVPGTAVGRQGQGRHGAGTDPVRLEHRRCLPGPHGRGGDRRLLRRPLPPGGARRRDALDPRTRPRPRRRTRHRARAIGLSRTPGCADARGGRQFPDDGHRPRADPRRTARPAPFHPRARPPRGRLWSGLGAGRHGRRAHLLRHGRTGRSVGLSPTQLSWIASIGFVGMALGATLGGLLADRFGRRQVFALTLLVFGVATGAAALSWSVGALLVFRFLIGLGLGAELPVASTLVSEFAPARLRGRVVVLLEAFWAIGWTLSALIGYLVVPRSDAGWRWALALGAVPALYAVAVRRGLPESVRFLELRGRVAEAEDAVRRFEGAAGVTPTPSPAPRPAATL